LSKGRDFVNRSKFSNEEIKVFPKNKNLAKKNIEVLPKGRGLAIKKWKFCQKI
jgi:hypothetical protein